MYGATEATARMAYLPPHLAHARPGRRSASRARRRPAYRRRRARLLRTATSCSATPRLRRTSRSGRTVHELRTGDLAIQHDDGLFQIVGRRSRTAKLFGLRVDLDHVERLLRDAGVDGRAVERDGTLTTFVRHGRAADKARRMLGRELCLPPHALAFPVVSEFPLTTSGKTDYPALVRHATGTRQPTTAGSGRCTPPCSAARTHATTSRSSQLGGDSLSFVEVSVRLERRLGRLPANWQELSDRRARGARATAAALDRTARHRRRAARHRDRAGRRQPHRVVHPARWRAPAARAGRLQPGPVPARPGHAGRASASGCVGRSATCCCRRCSGSAPSTIVSGKYEWSTVALSTNLVGPGALDRAVAVLVPGGRGLVGAGADGRAGRAVDPCPGGGPSLALRAGLARAGDGAALRVDRGRGRVDRALQRDDGRLVRPAGLPRRAVATRRAGDWS